MPVLAAYLSSYEVVYCRRHIQHIAQIGHWLMNQGRLKAIHPTAAAAAAAAVAAAAAAAAVVAAAAAAAAAGSRRIY